MTTLFKILVNGRSCHGGDFAWSLPKDRVHGDWHEVTGDVVQCQNGFHLTDWPPSWWTPGCTIYVVEAEGVVGDSATSGDRKCAAKKVRLLREASHDELAKVGVFLSGSHVFRDNARAITSGSAQVKAYGSAQVEAYDSAQVEAYGSAQVEAKDRVVVVSWRGKKGIRIEGPRVVAVIYPSFRWDETTMPQVLTAGGLLGVVPSETTPAPARGKKQKSD